MEAVTHEATVASFVFLPGPLRSEHHAVHTLCLLKPQWKGGIHLSNLSKPCVAKPKRGDICMYMYVLEKGDFDVRREVARGNLNESLSHLITSIHIWVYLADTGSPAHVSHMFFLAIAGTVPVAPADTGPALWQQSSTSWWISPLEIEAFGPNVRRVASNSGSWWHPTRVDCCPTAASCSYIHPRVGSFQNLQSRMVCNSDLDDFDWFLSYNCT